MKRAVFLHGTNGHPDHHWWPWLKQAFENAGYQVLAPLLPDNDKPNHATYLKFLEEQDWDYTDNILVGHSSGATTILNLLAEDSFPKVKAAVLVGAFINEKLTSQLSDFEQGQFDNLFPRDGFQLDKVKVKAEHWYFVHGNDDPYCSYDDAVQLASYLGGNMITIPNGGHLSTRFGITELPQLLTQLQNDQLL